MRRVVHNFTSYGLVASLFIIEAPKAGAAEITLTNANNAPINSNINTNAFNSTNGLTNTITWTNTTTAWTNYFASPAGGAPNFNGINWGSSESVNGLVIGGTYAATNIGTLVGVNPFVNVGSATGLIKVNGSFAGTNGLTKKGAGQLNFQSSFNTFTGGLTIEAGRVNFGTSNNIPTSNDLDLKGGSVNFGATNLNLTFANVRWGDGTLTGGAGSSLTAASYTLTNTSNITNTFVLAGAGGLNKSSGAGNFTLSAANTFGGVGVTNIVSAGTLTLGNASALGNTNNSFELRTGGTLNLNNISPTFSTFTFAGGALTTTNTNRSLTANTGFVVTGTNNVDVPYYLQGAGGFTQNGSGTTTLQKSGFSGTTAVNSGTLVVVRTNLAASITASSITVTLSNVPTTNPAIYTILTGPLAGTYSSVTVASPSGYTGTINTSTNVTTSAVSVNVIITPQLVGSTFTGLGYIAGSENELGSNGLKNLVNYALGGTGPSSTPAAPVFSISGTTLTLTGNIRNDDNSLTVIGQYAYDLNGPWTDVNLTDTTGASSTVAKTTVKSFTQTIESGQPRKFMRFQVSK
jgi:autotransporter-associated beta strand protein